MGKYFEENTKLFAEREGTTSNILKANDLWKEYNLYNNIKIG